MKQKARTWLSSGRDLLQQGAIPISPRVRDGLQYIHDGNKWTPEGKTGRGRALVLPDSLWSSKNFPSTQDTFLTAREELLSQTLSKPKTATITSTSLSFC